MWNCPQLTLWFCIFCLLVCNGGFVGLQNAQCQFFSFQFRTSVRSWGWPVELTFFFMLVMLITWLTIKKIQSITSKFLSKCNRWFANNKIAVEAVILGFQHFLVMIGTTVIIATIIVPQMGGGNVRVLHLESPIPIQIEQFWLAANPFGVFLFFDCTTCR